MADPWIWTMVSVVAVSLLSLVGALAMVLADVRSHRVMMSLVALAAGALLGDAFLHLIPEAANAATPIGGTFGLTILIGFFLFFGLEVVLRWEHAHAERGPGSAHHIEGVQPFGLLNLVGDGVHNFVDGVLIAAAFLADTTLGFVTAVAVAAHELPQELGDFGVLIRSGLRPTTALALNLVSALMAVIGAAIMLVLPLSVQTIQTVALPLMAGGFIYIAAADLIPELHHHAGHRDIGWLVASILGGVAAMGALVLID